MINKVEIPSNQLSLASEVPYLAITNKIRAFSYRIRSVQPMVYLTPLPFDFHHHQVLKQNYMIP